MTSDFRLLLQSDAPILALAPMQDVTDLRFMRLISGYGNADLYFTEYFRVLPDSRLDPQVLASITQNPTGRPVIAQMIGNDIAALVRTARELQQNPVAAIDLNLGCPVPIVYRKCAGGGLLRDPDRIDRILGALREAITIPFTVKTRIGFDDATIFGELLPIFARHSLDLLTVHARTVKEMYRSAPRYDFIARAVAAMSCPVLANGNIYSADKAAEVLALTGATMEKLKKFGGQTPMGRPGQPAELASIYVQLAANDASYSTGQIYGAAGGSVTAVSEK